MVNCAQLLGPQGELQIGSHQTQMALEMRQGMTMPKSEGVE